MFVIFKIHILIISNCFAWCWHECADVPASSQSNHCSPLSLYYSFYQLGQPSLSTRGHSGCNKRTTCHFNLWDTARDLHCTSSRTSRNQTSLRSPSNCRPSTIMAKQDFRFGWTSDFGVIVKMCYFGPSEEKNCATKCLDLESSWSVATDMNTVKKVGSHSKKLNSKPTSIYVTYTDSLFSSTLMSDKSTVHG